MNLFTRPGDPAVNVRAQQHQYDRRGSRLELVHEPDLHARRHDRRDHQGAQHVGRPGARASGPSSVRRSAGVSPGFTIRDEKGEVWFISFDARGNPVAATAVVPVATRLFWALGYYQVESYITTIRPEDIVIGDTATIRGARQAPADAAR